MVFFKFSINFLSGFPTSTKPTKMKQKQQSQSILSLQDTDLRPQELFLYTPTVNKSCLGIVPQKTSSNTMYQGIYSEKSEFLINYYHTPIPTLPTTSSSFQEIPNVVSFMKTDGNQLEKESSLSFSAAETYSSRRDDSNSDLYRMCIPHQRKTLLRLSNGSNTIDSPTSLLSSPQVQQLQKKIHDGDNTTMTVTAISDDSSSDSTTSSVRDYKISANMSDNPVVVVIGEAKSDYDTPQYTSVSGNSRSISSRRFTQSIKSPPENILVNKKQHFSSNYPTPVQTPKSEHYRPSSSSEDFVFDNSINKQHLLSIQEKISTIPMHRSIDRNSIISIDRNSIISIVSTIISTSDESFSRSPEWSDSPLSTEFPLTEDYYHCFSNPGVQFLETVEKPPDLVVAVTTEVQLTNFSEQNPVSLVVNKTPAELPLEEFQQDENKLQQKSNQPLQSELHIDPSSVIAKLMDKNPFLPIIMNLCGENNHLYNNNNYSHHYDDELELFDYYLTIS